LRIGQLIVERKAIGGDHLLNTVASFEDNACRKCCCFRIIGGRLDKALEYGWVSFVIGRVSSKTNNFACLVFFENFGPQIDQIFNKSVQNLKS
jgi:hypothetical protein